MVKTIALAAAVCWLGVTAEPQDPVGLMNVIVDAGMADLGLGPAATKAPIISGQFYVDRSFIDRIEEIFGDSAGVEVEAAVLARGLAFRSYEELIEPGPGRPHRLADDAALMGGLILYPSSRVAMVTLINLHNYRAGMCFRRYDLALRYDGSAWQIVRQTLEAAC